MSGFFRFAATVRDEVNARGLVGKHAGKEIGRLWKKVDQETKDEYQEAFQEEMEVYREKFAAYKETPSYRKFQEKKKAQKQRKKFLKKIKDPNKPKRAPSAYFLFMGDARPKVAKAMPDASIGDIGKKLGEMWRELSEEQKAKYQKKTS